MNQSQHNDTEALRTDIDTTRRRMDDTIEALGDRMQPRHLLDEVLGYFRRTDDNGSSRLSTMRESVTHGTNTAVHAVVDTVKHNPLPALLIGAGVAWMIYNTRRSSHSDASYYTTDDTDTASYDPDAHLDRPLDYPIATSGTAGISEAGWSDQGMQGPSKLGKIKDGIGSAAGSAKQKIGAMGHAAGEKLTAARHRAGEIGTRVRQRSGEMYTATRERVVTTADQHPIETGLVCLAAGLIAGLALPTPSPVNRRLGPTADRLRERARESGQEMLEKGKRVATAAVSAVKEEAQAQGLTPERLREKATAVADRAKEAGKETARNEGLTTNKTGTQGNPPGSQYNDPTVARPGA
jgi:ElaB/YqjD/DUF883 family membrane-anchored ribosome-binding protein